MTDSPLPSNERRFLAFILVAIVLFVGADLFNDFAEGVKLSHLVLELAIALGSRRIFCFDERLVSKIAPARPVTRSHF